MFFKSDLNDPKDTNPLLADYGFRFLRPLGIDLQAIATSGILVSFWSADHCAFDPILLQKLLRLIGIGHRTKHDQRLCHPNTPHKLMGGISSRFILCGKRKEGAILFAAGKPLWPSFPGLPR